MNNQAGTSKLQMNLQNLIEQIKTSENNLLQTILNSFETHKSFVSKTLSDISSLLKNSTTTTNPELVNPEIVKVKDPLEEIKSKKQYFDECLSLNKPITSNNTYYYNILVSIVDILSLYSKDKISNTFKDIFLYLFNNCLSMILNMNRGAMIGSIVGTYIDSNFIINLKQKILKVRDIRWLLNEMEKYPHLFSFTDSDLELMKVYDASRDNIYLVKRILKKDGEYEEYYPDESLKCK